MQRGLQLGVRLVCRGSSTVFLHSQRTRQATLQIRRQFSITKPEFTKMSYSIEERDSPNTLDYRIFIRGPNGVVSPFHDIPLFANEEKTTYNMVVEVPRWSNAKMEIDTKSRMNPIKQDTKNNKLRFVHNCFPHHGYIWNYGALPQTWEDPNHKDPDTGCLGDNDPIDVCEIGFKVHGRGEVIQVKPLGVMALIDEGETDWKVIAIDVTDPLAADLNDIEDVEKHMPGFIKATQEWFRIYKIPAGKPENQFAFNGEAKDKAFTMNVIQQTHQQWQRLISKSAESNLSCDNVTVNGSPFLISQEEAQAAVDETKPLGDAAPIAPEVDKWHYVKL